MAPLSQGAPRGCPWPEFAEQKTAASGRVVEMLACRMETGGAYYRKLDFQRRPHRVLEHLFGGTAAKIIIVLERISRMTVVVGLLLGGLSGIVQFVGLRGDDTQAISSCFARLWRFHRHFFCATH